MNETEYTYAVARIRANELKLLSADDISQMINAPDRESAERILTDKGWDIPEGSREFDPCEKELADAWKLIEESVPSSELLEALVIGNDFSNLKAAIKCIFSSVDPEKYYFMPCITDTEIITKAIREADFKLLPEHLEKCAEEAYSAVSKHQSGQLSESIIDKASLEAKLEYAKKSESPLLERITEMSAVAANIKTALRCVSMGKTKEFALDSMCKCALNNEEMLENASSNEKMAEYLQTTDYAFLAESIKESFTAFEKLCDNTVASLIKEKKYDIYGADPVVAYYFAKTAETKNARIILSAKASGVPADAISERVRDMYV